MAKVTKSRKPVKGTVRLRHATPERNLLSIADDGLLCSKAKGKMKVVWLHTAAKSTWAVIHTVGRHGGRVQDVVVLELSIPRSWLRRNRRGLWYSTRDIPPGRIVDVVDFDSLSESPVEAA
ncbi:MAG TPA: hypothetical protein VEL76_12250 [Gemmataceae bacterium]|nr:hypothetical protein [Gemmataceae bacterium]